MPLMKFKTVTRLLLAAGISGGGAMFLGLVMVGAANSPAERTNLSWIDERVAAWELSEEERRFDEIGWVGGLNEAERLARDWKRPLFVFTYSGSATEANAIALRRC